MGKSRRIVVSSRLSVPSAKMYKQTTSENRLKFNALNEAIKRSEVKNSEHLAKMFEANSFMPHYLHHRENLSISFHHETKTQQLELPRQQNTLFVLSHHPVSR